MSAPVHAASDTGVSDNSVQNRDKPAMAVGHSRAVIQPAPGRVLPGAPPRGPLASKLAGKVDLRLSGILREAVRSAAKEKGLTDGAYIRTILADHLGAEAPADRASGLRKREPSELAVRIAAAVRELGAAYTPLAQQPPDIAGAKGHLARVRETLLPIMREESRG
jgi:hypothetical protein